MRVTLSGVVVDVEQKSWEFNGRHGVTYKAFVRCGSERESAQGVRMTNIQFSHCAVGETAEWPVDVFPQASDYGAPQLKVSLPEHYNMRTGLIEDAPVPQSIAPMASTAF